MYINVIISLIYSLLEILSVLLPVLLSVAYVTVIERKEIASMQRRIGPNAVGYYGSLQPFADALKLIVKEIVLPERADGPIFYLAPIISILFAVLGWAIIPFSPGIALLDWPIGILYSLAVTSLGVYGIFFAGWASNTKWAFIGALRATALIISYELIYSSAVFSVLSMAGSYNFSYIIIHQTATWYILPLMPIIIIFVIAAIAELNRTPIDNTEAESELVSGFMTEHSGVIFVLFFLSEYCSLVFISTFIAVIFIGGSHIALFYNHSTAINAIVLGLKAVIWMYIFVWIRATLPRIRFDQLMIICWTKVLPIIFAQITMVISIIVAFNI